MTTTDDDARRAAVQDALEGFRFPATRDQAVAWAEAAGARDAVVTDLRSLRDQEFADPEALLAALGIDTGEAPDVGTVDPEETVGDPSVGRSMNKAAPVREPAPGRDRMS